MSHHFQILSLCERKNLRDLCRESNPGPLNYMSRAHYLYHWIRDLDLASSFLKQPKMRDLGVHFPKIFRGGPPNPPFLAAFGRFATAPPPHLKTSSYASDTSHSKLSAKTASEDCMLFCLQISVSLHDKVLGLLDLDRYQYSLQGMSTSQ